MGVKAPECGGQTLRNKHVEEDHCAEGFVVAFVAVEVGDEEVGHIYGYIIKIFSFERQISFVEITCFT